MLYSGFRFLRDSFSWRIFDFHFLIIDGCLPPSQSESEKAISLFHSSGSPLISAGASVCRSEPDDSFSALKHLLVYSAYNFCVSRPIPAVENPTLFSSPPTVDTTVTLASPLSARKASPSLFNYFRPMTSWPLTQNCSLFLV